MKIKVSAIETIQGSQVWQTVKQAFETGSQKNYVDLIAGQCKSAVSAIFQQCNRSKIFIPVYPVGRDHIDAFHCYGLLGPVIGQDPAQDVIVDPTIGQIVPAWGPYFGGRHDLKEKLKSAFEQGAVNPDLIKFLARRTASEPVTAELIFKNYYDDDSWNAFTGKKLKRATAQPQ